MDFTLLTVLSVSASVEYGLEQAGAEADLEIISSNSWFFRGQPLSLENSKNEGKFNPHSLWFLGFFSSIFSSGSYYWCDAICGSRVVGQQQPRDNRWSCKFCKLQEWHQTIYAQQSSCCRCHNSTQCCYAEYSPALLLPWSTITCDSFAWIVLIIWISAPSAISLNIATPTMTKSSLSLTIALTWLHIPSKIWQRWLVIKWRV